MRMRWAGLVTRTGGAMRSIQGFHGQHEGKRPLGRSRRRREHNIKMDLQEIERRPKLDWFGSR